MASTRDYAKIQKEIALTGFFSEYLPPCFSLDERVLSSSPPEKCDLIPPVQFSMSRFTNDAARRIVSIPEIGSYLATYTYMKRNNIIQKLIEISENNVHSFSKDLDEDTDAIVRHDQSYGEDNGNGGSEKYIKNIIKKLILSTGAKKILKLDISNCYASFYTHMLPTIVLSIEETYENFYKYEKNEDCSEAYKIYRGLDDSIRRQNLNRTNGLLVGPLFSKIIVEAMLSRIDGELSERGYKFVRYVDDYEFFLYQDNEKEVISKVENILKKYCFTLNSEKIEVVDFPYYIIENFNKITLRGFFSDEELVDVFSTFMYFEKQGIKGAIRYLIKKFPKNITTEDTSLYKSYLITIMANDERSLINVCSSLIDLNKNFSPEEKERIYQVLRRHIAYRNELEIIWITYLLIQTRSLHRNDGIIHEIFEVKNDLVSLMLYKYNLLDDQQIQALKEAASWILLYELYADDKMEENDFLQKLHIKKNGEMYKKFKESDIHFLFSLVRSLHQPRPQIPLPAYPRGWIQP